MPVAPFRDSDVSRAALGWALGGLALCAVIAGALTYALVGGGPGGAGPQAGTVTVRGGVPPQASASAAEILQHAGRFAGHTVVVGGGMGRRLGSHAFTFGQPVNQPTPPTAGGLLVVAARVPSVRPGHPLEATGRVVLLRARNAARELPYRLPRAVLRRFARHAVLVARRVTSA